MMRRAHVIVLLLCAFRAPMAEEMIILENGTVADADDLNHNFSLLDKDGPTLVVGDLVVNPEGDGLNGTVSVTASDPSGVWRVGEIYSDDFYNQKVGVDGDTSLNQEFDVSPLINTSTDHYFFAEDFKGNKTIEKRTYVGPTTAIKAGRYTPDAQDFTPDPCNPSSVSPLDAVDLRVHPTSWPVLRYQLSWILEGAIFDIGSYLTNGYFGPDDYEASGTSDNSAITTSIAVNQDSTLLTVVFTRTQDCDGDGADETTGPLTYTFTLSERY